MALLEDGPQCSMCLVSHTGFHSYWFPCFHDHHVWYMSRTHKRRLTRDQEEDKDSQVHCEGRNSQKQLSGPVEKKEERENSCILI